MSALKDSTKIEWADYTFNPWIGCQHVGPGCDHCYAEQQTPARVLRANGKETWGPHATRQRTTASTWAKPKRWDALAKADGVRRRVFCASLADVFDNQVPESWRTDLFTLIDETPYLDWLLVTKRIRNAHFMLPALFDETEWPNVWIGATVVNQAEFDRDIGKLLAIPARVRFLSLEPLLGPIDLEWALGDLPEDEDGAPYPGNGIDWVIVGGESGPDARPMHRYWVRSLRDQCLKHRTPFFFKQWGEYAPNFYLDDDGREIPGSLWMDRMGKKSAGRLLDGVEHSEWPA